MRPDLTDVTLVVDRSGSMDAIREDAEGGVNSFIQDLGKGQGEALLTLVQFDTEYEFVHKGVPSQDVPKYELHPRGMTALLDAVGRAINETGQRLAALEEKDRPGLVLFVIMTDGMENSSVEFSKSQVKKMIEHQQAKYQWHFTFLGANQDAFSEAGGMGVQAAGVAQYSPSKVSAAYDAVGAKVARMRAQASAGEEVKNEFTDEEREQMM
ncbi:MAG: vWA domain-containing protein [Planctomycetota bacterium]